MRSLLRLTTLLFLPGCLVSFNDYPLDASVEGAGAGGSGSTLPSAGKGGQPSREPSVLDDFEDTTASILPQPGRFGTWYTGNDGTGTQTPPADDLTVPSALEPARGESTRGAHTFGGPFTQWGALIGTSLASDPAESTPYNLSGYRGVRLWVRSGSTAPSAAKTITLAITTPATSDPDICLTKCNDHFSFDFPLTAQWSQVTVPFTSLKQNGGGLPRPDLTQAQSLQFFVAKDLSFDIWLDDIELY